MLELLPKDDSPYRSPGRELEKIESTVVEFILPPAWAYVLAFASTVLFALACASAMFSLMHIAGETNGLARVLTLIAMLMFVCLGEWNTMIEWSGYRSSYRRYVAEMAQTDTMSDE
jgi:hypothetical protein